MWVILVLSVFSVADRVILTYRVLEQLPERPPAIAASPLPVRMLWNAFFWTFDRATWQYNVMVIAILAFTWLTPPDWLRDPMAYGTRTDRVALTPSVTLPTPTPQLPINAQRPTSKTPKTPKRKTQKEPKGGSV